MADPSPGPPPGRWLIFAVVSTAFLMGSIDQTIVATALPTIGRDLGASLTWTGWTLTVYALGRVLVMPVAGRLADQFSRRTVFLVAVVVFTVASLGCGLTDDIHVLIGLRALQSIGGGAFMPSGTGIVADRFGPSRDRAIGLFSSILPIGGIIGPVLGGLFVAYWSWRGIFLVNVPIGVVLLFLAHRFIPAGSRGTRQTRLDIRGMVLLGVGILGAMTGVSYLGQPGARAGSPWLVVPEAVALVAFVLLGFHITRAAHPFISVRLLRGRGLGPLAVINVLYGGAAVGLAALVPLYATQRYGISALASGTLLSARAVGVIVTAGLAAWSLRRTGYRRPIVAGLVIAAIGLFLLAAPATILSPYVWLALAAAISGVGMGIATPASNNASLETAPDEVSAITGLRGMFRQVGSIATVSVTTAILARSAQPGLAQADVYVAYGLILLCAVPLAFLVREHRGAW